MKEQYDLMIKQIKAFEEELHAETKFDNLKQKYYKGIQVLASPLLPKPKFMFIGINPGIGFHKENGRNVKRFEPLQHFEYLHYNYLLARETRSVFAKAGLSKELTSSVKSNCFFISTDTEKALHKFMGHINGKYQIYKKQRLWLKELVSLVGPQIIICEGKSAFETLIGEKVQASHEVGGHLSCLYNSVPVIGYRRKRSFIADKDSLATLIKNTYIALS